MNIPIQATLVSEFDNNTITAENKVDLIGLRILQAEMQFDSELKGVNWRFESIINAFLN